MATPLPTTKEALLTTVETARAHLEGVIDGLSYAQMIGPHDQKGWSARDHVAHLTVWEEGLVALFHCQPRHSTMGVSAEDFATLNRERLNALLWQQSQSQTLAEIIYRFNRVHRSLHRILQGISWADLQRPVSDYCPTDPEADNAPILAWVVALADHYAHHEAAIVSLSKSKVS